VTRSLQHLLIAFTLVASTLVAMAAAQITPFISSLYPIMESAGCRQLP
jgi:hypothetical protein